MTPEIFRLRHYHVDRFGARANHGARQVAVALLAAVMVLSTPALMPGLSAAQARSAPASFADLAAALSPAVVNISTTQIRKVRQRRPQQMPKLPPGSPFEKFFRDFFERNQRRSTSLGSGFVIDAGGLIVTNNHVIEGADEIRVRFHDNTTAKATVVGRDPKVDIALLRVKTKKKLVAVPWGDSERLRVGDWVLAIGNPFGFGGTVTAGIVSARQRDINAGPYDDFIQTDASINRGNSGGPLFNMDGEVVGINTAIISPSGGSIGIGFSIPSALARPVIEQLRKFGRTKRGWLGVRIQTVTREIAESLGLKKASGALVASVTEKGPAAVAGLRQGDIILRLDGKDITRMRELPRIVAETAIGRSVDVVLWRDGRRKTLRVRIGELKEGAVKTAKVTSGPGVGSSGPSKRTIEMLGLELSILTKDLRARYGLPDETKGVIVTGVTPDSIAAGKGLRAGDVIVEAGQKEVTQPDQVRKKVLAAKRSGRRSILLLVQRGSAPPRFLALKIDKS